MPAPFSEDLRIRVISAIYDDNMRKEEAAERYDVSLSTVKRWMKRWEEEGHVEARTGYQNGHSHSFEDLKVLTKFVTKNPDLTSEEISQELGICNGSTIRRWLHRLGYSKKKVIHVFRGR